MNGILRLIKNEIIKVFSQLSWKIITAIILVLSVGLPVINYYADKAFNSYSNNLSSYESAEDGTVYKEYRKVYYDTDKFFEENGISEDDWKYSMYVGDIQNLTMRAAAFGLVADGYDVEEVFDWMWADNVDVSYEYDESKDDYKMVINYHPSDGVEAEVLDSDTAAKERDMAVDNLNALKKTVVEFTFKDYIESIIAAANEELAEAKGLLDAAEKIYDVNQSNSYDYEAAKYRYEGLESKIALLEAMKNGDKDDENWLLKTYMYADSLPLFEDAAKVTEGDFSLNKMEGTGFKTYSDYVKYQNKLHDDSAAAMAMLIHSAETKNPMPQIIYNETRNATERSMTNNASMVTFFCMILAATIVANEHTSGTIRLLLIRPRSRWKILLSKLVCVMVYAVAAYAAATLLSFVTDVILYGTKDIFSPYIGYSGGSVREIPMIVYTAAHTFVYSLPSVMLIFFAFGLSVIAKKVVFAVAMPLLVSMFGNIASELSWMLIDKAPFLRWTIFPYFELNSVVNSYDPILRFTGNIMDVSELMLSPVYGVVHLIALIVVAVIISFAVFKKQQIKS